MLTGALARIREAGSPFRSPSQCCPRGSADLTCFSLPLSVSHVSGHSFNSTRKVRLASSPVCARAAGLLEVLTEPCQARNGVALRFHARAKGEDGRAQAEALLDAARASATAPVLGVLSKARSPSPGAGSELHASQSCVIGWASIQPSRAGPGAAPRLVECQAPRGGSGM